MIIVCILTNNPHTDQVKRLYTCFEHDIFKIQVYNVRPNKKLNDEALFKYRLEWCLKDTARNYPHDHILIIRDNVICSTDTNTLATIVNEALNDKHRWDVIYLSAWGDDCSKYKRITNLSGLNMYISDTKGPNGTGAFLLSPDARTKLLKGDFKGSVGSALKSNIHQGNMSGSIVMPTPMMTDPTANSNWQELNLHTNSGTKYNKTNDSSNHGISLWWFFLILIIVALLIFVTIYYYR